MNYDPFNDDHEVVKDTLPWEIHEMSSDIDTRTWPELAIGLYDKLTERNAQIAYDFADFEVAIPSSTQGDAEQARWRLNGRLSIRTSNGS